MDLWQKMQGVDFVLVAEFSMIGEGTMGVISVRCKQAMEGQTRFWYYDRHIDLFSELSLILVGDPMQLFLPSVRRPCGRLIHEERGSQLSRVARVVGHERRCGVDTSNTAGEAGASRVPSDTAARVGQGAADQSDRVILHAQFTTRVQEAERTRFDDAVHTSTTNAAADECNWRHITDLGTRIESINADHTIGGYAVM